MKKKSFILFIIIIAIISVCKFYYPEVFKKAAYSAQNIVQMIYKKQVPKESDKKQEEESHSTVMTRINGVETLTGGSIPIKYFCQNDTEWKDKLYGTDPIGIYGCGPTALAMVVNSLNLAETDPSLMSAFCVEHGYWAEKGGSYHNIVQGVSEAFGITCKSPEILEKDELCKRLSGGEIAIALMGPGHFTEKGHFIILRGLTEKGNVLVADPMSRVHSLQEWHPQLIIDELSDSRDSGAPLWFLYLSS